jgi:hypothetical protein
MDKDDRRLGIGHVLPPLRGPALLPIVVRAEKCVNLFSVATDETASMDLGHGSGPSLDGIGVPSRMRRDGSVFGT